MAKDVHDSDDRLDGSTGHLSDRLESGRPADVAADRGPFAKAAEQDLGDPARSSSRDRKAASAWPDRAPSMPPIAS